MVGDKSPGASNKLVDLAVYYSNQDDMSDPSEQIHQLKFINPTKPCLMHAANGCEVFSNDWIYLGLYSEIGCELSILCFNSEEYLAKRR